MSFVGLADFSDQEKVFDFKAIVVDSDLKKLNFTKKMRFLISMVRY